MEDSDVLKHNNGIYEGGGGVKIAIRYVQGITSRTMITHKSHTSIVPVIYCLLFLSQQWYR